MVSQWAEASPHTDRRLPGTKGQGQFYEDRVGKRLAQFCEDIGWSFHDHRWIIQDTSYMQPDFVLESPSGAVILVECKRTWKLVDNQLHKYKQALQEMGHRVSTLLVVRHLTPEAPAPIYAIEDMSDGSIWHLLL